MNRDPNKWKRELEMYLKAIVAPQIGFEEFYGDGTTMGFFHHVMDIVRDCRKEAYLSGFYDGVCEVVKEDPKLTVDPVVNKITAERLFLKWE